MTLAQYLELNHKPILIHLGRRNGTLSSMHGDTLPIWTVVLWLWDSLQLCLGKFVTGKQLLLAMRFRQQLCISAAPKALWAVRRLQSDLCTPHLV